MDRTTRRAFLGGATASAAALIALRDPFAIAQTGMPVARGGRFAQGVACGQQTPTGITLWSRVDELAAASRVQFEVATDRDFRRIVHRQDAVAGGAAGGTALQRVEGLTPGTEYFYRCFTCDVNSSVGRFRTAYPADSREPVRVGFFSCQDWEAGFYTAHVGLAAEELDLVVCLGDYIYERSFYEGPRTDPTGQVETLAEYRSKYGVYHGDPNLIAVRERFPLIAIWDDHEVEDNHAGDLPGGAYQLDGEEGTFADQRRVPYLDRRQSAYDAFFEHMPRIRLPGAERNRIYGSIPLGGSAEVFLLDQRQYRSDQPCNPDDSGFRDNQECPTNDPLYADTQTLLGAEQDRWLRERLVASQQAGTRWKLVGNQVMIMALDVGTPGLPINDDQWDGYGFERGELLQFAQTEGIQDIAFVTGDIHTFFAGDVTPSGRFTPTQGDRGFNRDRAATEFVIGSITSRGFGDATPDPQTGSQAFEAGILSENPHIRYMDGERRGYGVLEARDEELLVTYRQPLTTQEEQTEIVTGAEFRVAKGSNTVEVVSVSSGTARPV